MTKLCVANINFKGNLPLINFHLAEGKVFFEDVIKQSSILPRKLLFVCGLMYNWFLGEINYQNGFTKQL